MAALKWEKRAPVITTPRSRRRLVEFIRQQGVCNEHVLASIDAIPRHLFVDEALANHAYENTALPIGNQQTISQPYTVARMTELLMQGRPLQKVLEIGTGSGYQTAVLASLTSRVYTIERIESLLEQARRRFRTLDLNNIRTYHGDGGLGWPDPMFFDGIMVTAAPLGIPLKLIEQLHIGGRMVLPIGQGDQQALVLVVRTRTGHAKKILEQVSFVPLCSGIQ